MVPCGRGATGCKLADGRGWGEQAMTMAGRVRALAVAAGKGVRPGLERWLLRYSQVAITPFLDRGDFAWAAMLEHRWQPIRAELDQVLRRHDNLPNVQDLVRGVASVSRDDQWKTFFFLGYGLRSQANCDRCPGTSAVLDEIPGLVTAFFVILSPGKRIPPHRGQWRGVVRCQVGLLIPDLEQSCGISVGGQTRHWREGEAMFFDSGYEHFAWNDGNQMSAVLLLDVLRPFRQPAASINQALVKIIGVSPFLNRARRQQRAHDHRFGC